MYISFFSVYFYIYDYVHQVHYSSFSNLQFYSITIKKTPVLPVFSSDLLYPDPICSTTDARSLLLKIRSTRSPAKVRISIPACRC